METFIFATIWLTSGFFAGVYAARDDLAFAAILLIVSVYCGMQVV